MAKAGKFFPIFAVLTLLILLAPAVILTPGGSVAQAGDANTTAELEVNFSVTENIDGDWRNFTAGISEVPVTLKQYTRADVNNTQAMGSNVTMPGCALRNYTTASGTVSGDLSGNISLKFNIARYNATYPGALYYGSATSFGLIVGRGDVDCGGGNSFTFTFIGDYDSNNNMSSAVGKGYMVSTNENGTYSSHKIIGEIDFSKSGSSYTGTFHLRNYPPEEIFYYLNANLNASANSSVIQEPRDPIYKPMNLVYLNPIYGDYHTVQTSATPPDDKVTLEEIAEGQEPLKNITGGFMGKNGTIDGSRNSFVSGGQAGSGAELEGIATEHLIMNDTYAKTGNDSTLHGILHQILLLDILHTVRTSLQLGVPMWQLGYAFSSFGMPNQGTESYAGTESYGYVNMGLTLQLPPANLHQQSSTLSYALLPHPKVASVTPASGLPNTTMNVTIGGKYFVRAGPTAPGASVSFGSGITVNSWSLQNSSGMDNAIIANITIAAGATLGSRDVNVTACFGYENATFRTYESGVKVGGFTVGVAGSTLQGHVGLSSLPATNITVRFFTPNTTTQVMKKYGSTNSSGNFTIGNITAGTYDVAVKGETSLANLVTNVTFSSSTYVDFGVLVEGDTNDDDFVDASDYAALSYCWLSRPGDDNWYAKADFCRDRFQIDASEYAVLSFDWQQKGATFAWPGSWA